MAWQFVGVSNVVEVATTAHTLVTTGIAGLRGGELLIACISSRIASTASITLPTGGAWTLVSEQKNNNILATTSAAASGMMAYAIRGLSNPNLTFTHPVAPAPAIGRIVAYRQVNTTSAKDTQTSFTTAINTLPVSGTGLTTTQIEDLIVAMAAGGQEAAWSAFNATDPAGASGATDTTTAPTTTWIERADSSTLTGNDTSLAIFDAVKLTSGATGNLTATASLGAAHVVIAGAFRISNPTADAWNVDDKIVFTLSNSDKTATISSGIGYVRSSFGHTKGSAGKYYSEFLLSDVVGAIQLGLLVKTIALGAGSGIVVFSDGSVNANAASIGDAWAGTWVDSDVICCAWDAGASLVWFRLNGGNWNNSGSANPATGTGGFDVSAGSAGEYALWLRGDTSGDSVTLRTESAEFTYTGPSGFTSWMGEALAAPSVTGTGTPAGQAGAASGAGISESTGTGTPAGQSAAVSGTGTAGSAAIDGTGAIVADAAAVSGSGSVSAAAATGTGALAAQTAAVAGAGVSASIGSGALAAQAATASGAGAVTSIGTGALAAQAAAVAGVGSSVSTGTGALQAAAAVVVGAGASASTGTGSLVAGSAEVAGTGTAAAANSGALVAQAAALAGLGVSASTGSGALQAGASAIAGAGLVASVGTGDLVAGPATVVGTGEVIAAGAAVGTGALVAGAATLSGEGEVTGEVAPPVSAAIGGHWRPEPPRPELVEGVGYAILPELEGEAHGVVLIAGAGAVPAPRIIGVGIGAAGVAGRSAATLATVKVAAIGERGQTGAARAVLKAAAASGSGVAGAYGTAAGTIRLKGSAVGRHDDDEAAILALLLAA